MNRISERAWNAFQARVSELGGSVEEPTWLGSLTRHRCVCAGGHRVTVRPNSLQQGFGMCRTCAGQDTRVAEREFRRRVADFGGIVVGPYVNVGTPVECVCPQGHSCAPRPNGLQGGGGMCRVCAGMDSVSAEANFRVTVGLLGGVVVGVYLKSGSPVHVICRNGHDCYPTPNNIQRGAGFCAPCAGRKHDVYYVVAGNGMVKPGITSGNPNARLRQHASSHGLIRQLLVLEGLPEGDARWAEAEVLSQLKDLGATPVHGREFFGEEWTDTVLQLTGWYL